ncbi:putative Helicase domino [Blattamonas nauphoetae]|uniref:Helicase domino n=1 Tax=Blattamonas nauphoetae TaxID=2049346 RepID=A0ABQ9XDH9_9EUKA|nr:putative Helicase domino [Blattamonas nauphoetae]
MQINRPDGKPSTEGKRGRKKATPTPQQIDLPEQNNFHLVPIHDQTSFLQDVCDAANYKAQTRRIVVRQGERLKVEVPRFFLYRSRKEEEVKKEKASVIAAMIKQFWDDAREFVSLRHLIEKEEKIREVKKESFDTFVEQMEDLSRIIKDSIEDVSTPAKSSQHLDSIKPDEDGIDSSEEFDARRDANELDELRNEAEKPMDQLLMDVSKQATSMAPTGTTLASTEIKTEIPFLLKGPGPLREYQMIGLDWLMNMYEKNLNVILADEMGLGKAQPVDSPILTPSGWRRIGDIRVGDQVVACDGSTTSVTGVFPQGRKEVFRVVLDDGTWADCTDEHLWTVQLDNDKGNSSTWVSTEAEKWSTKTTRELIGLLSTNSSSIRLPIAQPIHFSSSQSTQTSLSSLDLSQSSFVLPESLLFSDIQTRTEILRQIIHHHSPSTHPTDASIRISTLSSSAANSLIHLVQSLGGVVHRLASQHGIQLDISLPSQIRQNVVGGGSQTDEGARLKRSIVSIIPLPSTAELTVLPSDSLIPPSPLLSQSPSSDITSPTTQQLQPLISECVCISVSHPSQLYITSSFIVTHNTVMTIAVLAALACQKNEWGPHLIIVPSSVLINWEMEFKRWCPAFKILSYYGTTAERKKKREGWSKPDAFHVCITSYKLVIQDKQIFRPKRWNYMILDEAHNIKNFKSKRWQILLNFNTRHRLLLTGTPLQNDIMELWSFMHFLMPEVFRSHSEFKEWFANPISNSISVETITGDGYVNREGLADTSTPSTIPNEIVSRLHNILRPFLLRRLKVDVEKQLPAKHEHVILTPLSKRQRLLYEEFLSAAETQKTLKSGSFMGLCNVLMQLRKVCNHPTLFEENPISSPLSLSSVFVQSKPLSPVRKKHERRTVSEIALQKEEVGSYPSCAFHILDAHPIHCLHSYAPQLFLGFPHLPLDQPTLTLQPSTFPINSMRWLLSEFYEARSHQDVSIQQPAFVGSPGWSLFNPSLALQSIIPSSFITLSPPQIFPTPSFTTQTNTSITLRSSLSLPYTASLPRIWALMSITSRDVGQINAFSPIHSPLSLPGSSNLPPSPIEAERITSLTPKPEDWYSFYKLSPKVMEKDDSPSSTFTEGVIHLRSDHQQQTPVIRCQSTNSFLSELRERQEKVLTEHILDVMHLNTQRCDPLTTAPLLGFRLICRLMGGLTLDPTDSEEDAEEVPLPLENDIQLTYAGRPKTRQPSDRRRTMMKDEVDDDQLFEEKPDSLHSQNALLELKRQKRAEFNAYVTETREKQQVIIGLGDIPVEDVTVEPVVPQRRETRGRPPRNPQPSVSVSNSPFLSPTPSPLLTPLRLGSTRMSPFLSSPFKEDSVKFDGQIRLTSEERLKQARQVSSYSPYVESNRKFSARKSHLRCGCLLCRDGITIHPQFVHKHARICTKLIQTDVHSKDKLDEVRHASFGYTDTLLHLVSLPIDLFYSYSGFVLKQCLVYQPTVVSQPIHTHIIQSHRRLFKTDELSSPRPLVSTTFAKLPATHQNRPLEAVLIPNYSSLYPLEATKHQNAAGGWSVTGGGISKMMRGREGALSNWNEVLEAPRTGLNLRQQRKLQQPPSDSTSVHIASAQTPSTTSRKIGTPKIPATVSTIRTRGKGLNDHPTPVNTPQPESPFIGAQRTRSVTSTPKQNSKTIKKSDTSPFLSTSSPDPTRSARIRFVRLPINPPPLNPYEPDTISAKALASFAPHSMSPTLMSHFSQDLPAFDSVNSVPDESFVDTRAPYIASTSLTFPPAHLVEHDCGKLQCLAVLLRWLYSNGHRCLIFTQMSKMLDVLEVFASHYGYAYLRLDGTTPIEMRQALMERFNRDSRVFLFLLSTRSGGVGVNLTGADTVIFYDSDWNPAMDAQAQDRAHRIGQTREVNVYRLVSRGTVEEKIVERAKWKRRVEQVVTRDGHFTYASLLNKADVEGMLGMREDKKKKTLSERANQKPKKSGKDKDKRKKKASGQNELADIFKSRFGSGMELLNVDEQEISEPDSDTDLESNTLSETHDEVRGMMMAEDEEDRLAAAEAEKEMFLTNREDENDFDDRPVNEGVDDLDSNSPSPSPSPKQNGRRKTLAPVGPTITAADLNDFDAVEETFSVLQSHAIAKIRQEVERINKEEIEQAVSVIEASQQKQTAALDAVIAQRETPSPAQSPVISPFF